MELKLGFKKTEVGIIPEDWDVVKLGEIGQCIIGLTYKPSDVGTDGLLVLRSSNIENGNLVFDDNVYVKVDVPEKLKVTKGDILICVRNGSRRLIGKCAMINEKAEGLTFGAFMSLYRTKYSGYIYYQLQSNLIKKQIDENIGATINQITNQNLNSFKIPLPGKAVERDAVTSALSDVDALIASLDALIAKKRAIKQGVMQELLTGKRRLPGFSGEWVKRKLGEICQIISGGTPSTSIQDYWNGDIDWCTPTDITSNHGKYLSSTERRITKKGLQKSSATMLPKGTLLLCSRATIGEIKIATREICTNQGFKSLVCSDDVHNEFLYYLLLTMKDKLIEKAIGSTFLEISKKDVSTVDVVLPKLKEQEAIAAILSDIDADIVKLEQQQEKTLLIKQGMMQELLTGRTRLV